MAKKSAARPKKLTEKEVIKMIGDVAHDLKGPLAATRGFVDLVQNAGPLTHDQQKFVDRAMLSMDRMEQLIGRLIEFSWLDSGKPLERAEIDLQAMLEYEVHLLEPIAALRRVQIHVASPDMSLGTAYLDPRHISQVFSNLLSNAIKYNKVGGEVWVSGVGDADTVYITIRDSGHGISEEHRSRIFDRFFRIPGPQGERIEGSGLGLSIVKTLVELHGGRISVDSVVGEGTVFHVSLPRLPRSEEVIVRELETRASNRFGDGKDHAHHESASEARDGVNDDRQEPSELHHWDALNEDR